MKKRFYASGFYATALLLSVFMIFIFILQKIFPIITQNFMLISSDVLKKPWILVTSIFLHSNVLHLVYNLFALLLFGLLTEKIIGSKNFLALFFISGILASIGSSFIYNAALGASGAIFGIIGCLIMLRPKGVILLYNIPMPMWLAGIVWAVADLSGLFAINNSNIANLAHLIGLATGLVYGIIIRKKYRRYKDKELREKQSKIEIDESEIENWENNYMRR